MKKVITLLFFLSTTILVFAQTSINKSIPLSNAQQISMDFEFADVVFSSWDRQEIQVTGSISINNGENDDAFQLISNKKGNILSLNTEVKDWKDLPKFTTVKKDGQKHYFKGKLDKADIAKKIGEGSYESISYGVIKKIKLQVKVPTEVYLGIVSKYGDLELQNCNNPLNVENIYGHIEASFEKGLPSEAKLHSTYSFVDVGLPARTNANIVLHSNYGTIYTDHDIAIDKSNSKEENFSRHIVGQLNSGGKKLSLKADYSNIYFRKM